MPGMSSSLNICAQYVNSHELIGSTLIYRRLSMMNEENAFPISIDVDVKIVSFPTWFPSIMALLQGVQCVQVRLTC